ncbi:MAG TPA: type II secretion system protein [Candidatus Saccharimonadales bacterium]|jgi:prepilin-type N-terminal cleavage/methylation domain-containing protein|nr:type II secretion system protein [Candidatus Saccharimonadales bacterium]
MNKLKQKRAKGFTIIEVVLVLAIAALIFLIVFLAVPALQGSQRDTQRRNDMGRLMSQLANYTANNKGKIPADGTQLTTFVDTYVKANGDQFADPTNGDYVLRLASSTSDFVDTLGTVNYYVGTKCDGENATTTGAGARSVTIRTKLERGGVYCQNN